MLKRLFFLSFLPFFCQAEDLPAPVKAIEKQGITIIKPFEAPGGVKGWLGKYQDMGVAIYLTPDGKHAISGYMYDENGNNLSEQLFQKELYTPAGQAMWKKMEAASWLQPPQFSPLRIRRKPGVITNNPPVKCLLSSRLISPRKK